MDIGFNIFIFGYREFKIETLLRWETKNTSHYPPPPGPHYILGFNRFYLDTWINMDIDIMDIECEIKSYEIKLF